MHARANGRFLPRQLTLFAPNPKTIKLRIEDLIERDYLERDSALARRSGCPAALPVPRPFHFPHPRPRTFAPQARTSGCCPTAPKLFARPPSFWLIFLCVCLCLLPEA